ncbi:MAG: CBS domain-containing protein [Burkholderiales bacterium]|nr:CBS domain-containing protein [Burkholderiales bacterium]
MEARDVMTTPVVTVSPDTPVHEIASLMVTRRISAVPVIDAAGKLAGIVSEGDLVRHVGAHTGSRHSWWLTWFAQRDDLAAEYTKSHGRTAADVMTRKVVTATESTPLDRIATLLERHRIKRVPVVRRGKVVGVVSRANLLHGLVAQRPAARPASVKDQDLRTRIAAELDRAGIDRAYVNVVVSNGSVELWGAVDNDTQRRAVALAAQNAKGVKRVVNNVAILPIALRGGAI